MNAFLRQTTLLEMVEDIQLCFEQGEQLANQGFYGEALIQFDRIIEVQPESVPAWIFRAVVLLHLDRYQEALESCDQALTLSPTDAEAWLFRGVALQRLNRYREAYACYENALGDRTSSQELTQQYDLPLLQRGRWFTSLWQSLKEWA
jgi:tetratricopeptide (TPR) repeat protein